jgi:hypothetical protein
VARGGRRYGLQEKNDIFYIIDENIKRLQPPPPSFTLKKIDPEEMCGARGGGSYYYQDFWASQLIEQ